MKYFSFLIYTLLFITIVTPVAIVIFQFFDIQFEVYGSYLFWFIALALFNAILPYQNKNIFQDEIPIQEYTNVAAIAKSTIKKVTNTLPSTIYNNTQGNVQQTAISDTSGNKKSGLISSFNSFF